MVSLTLALLLSHQTTLNDPLLDEPNLSFLLRFLSHDTSLELLVSCPNKKSTLLPIQVLQRRFLKTKASYDGHTLDSVLLFSHSVVSDSLGPHVLQHARLPCPSPSPRDCSDSCPSTQWCIQPSHPLSSPFPLAPNPSQHQSLFQWVNSSHEVAKVLELWQIEAGER